MRCFVGKLGFVKSMVLMFVGRYVDIQFYRKDKNKVSPITILLLLVVVPQPKGFFLRFSKIFKGLHSDALNCQIVFAKKVFRRRSYPRWLLFYHLDLGGTVLNMLFLLLSSSFHQNLLVHFRSFFVPFSSLVTDLFGQFSPKVSVKVQSFVLLRGLTLKVLNIKWL